jgi:hypothetical protein
MSSAENKTKENIFNWFGYRGKIEMTGRLGSGCRPLQETLPSLSTVKMSRIHRINHPLNEPIINALGEIAFYSDDHPALVNEYMAARDWIQKLGAALYHDWDLLYDILDQWPTAGKFVQTAVIIGETEALNDAVAELPKATTVCSK